jgi:hypothetical protein
MPRRVIVNLDERRPSKTHADLVACLCQIDPKERIKAFAAALLEIETREKRRPYAERRDSQTH